MVARPQEGGYTPSLPSVTSRQAIDTVAMEREGHTGAGPQDPAPSSGALSRRNILRKAIGLAAIGAVGGALLTEAIPSAASAQTTTETGALAPAVVALTDAPVIAVNAALGNDFRVTIVASRTMGNPSSPINGQQIIFQITQGPGGSTITWGSSYEFSTDLPQPALSTSAGQTDLLGFIYNAAKGTWLLAAFVNGFS